MSDSLSQRLSEQAYDIVTKPVDERILMLAIGLHEDDPGLQENEVFALSRADAIVLFSQLEAWLKPDMVPALRRLQYAANGLNFHQFCDALGWERNEYAKDKFVVFQSLGNLGRFDSGVLRRVIEAYEALGQ